MTAKRLNLSTFADCQTAELPAPVAVQGRTPRVARWLEDLVDPIFAERVLYVALLVHLVVPFFSMGNYQADELFQLLEPLSYRLGYTPQAALPWEFHSHIRPWLEIFVMRCIVWPLQALGIRDHLVYEHVFRLLASLLGFAALVALLRAFGGMLKTRRWFRWGVAGLALLWPIPFLHARISAECIGGSLFLISVAGLVDEQGAGLRQIAFAALMGASFMVRFQLGFAIAGFALHQALVRRVGAKRMLRIGAGVTVGIVAGVLADHWGYGVWVFTPWRYFHANIIDHVAAHFGTEPPWWYVTSMLTWLGPPFSVLFLGGLAGFWWLERRHVITWLSLPFFLAHCLVAHKELRFLFPLVPLLPLMTARFLETVAGWRWRWGQVAHGALCVYAVVNVIALVVNDLRPALTSYPYFAYVYRDLGDGSHIYWMGRQPMQLSKLQVYYYRPKHFRQTEVKSAAQLGSIISRKSIVLSVLKAQKAAVATTLEAHCTPLVSSVPGWMRTLDLDRFVSAEENWTLYRCRRATN